MTEEQLIKTLDKYIKRGDSEWLKEVQLVLIEYRDSGGKQEIAQKLVEQIALGYSNNEVFQDRAYEILDIVIGWCYPTMRVWSEQKIDNSTDNL